MNRRLITALGLTFASLIAFGQYPYPDEDLAVMALNRNLVVKLYDNESAVESAMNMALKEAFSETGQVIFLKPKEFEKTLKSKDNSFIYLDQKQDIGEDLRLEMQYLDGTMENWVNGSLLNPPPVASAEVKNFQFDRIILDYHWFDLFLFDGKRKKFLTSITFPNGMLAKHDFIFLRQQIDLLLNTSASGVMRANYMDVESNVDELSTLTCIYPRGFFTPDEADLVEENHETPYRLVAFEEYLNTILDKEKGMAYSKLVYSVQHNKYMWVMVKAEDGRILAINEIGEGKFSGEYDAEQVIKARQLKYSFHLPTQLLNNYYNK